MTILHAILEVLFPVNCVGCKKRGAYVCLDCLVNSPAAERETEEWIYALYDYRHPPIKKSIWLLKYKGRASLAETFAGVLHPRILEELADLVLFENFTDPLLIPIPLSRVRKRLRGFNQAELICKALVSIDGHQNFTLEKNSLIKNKETVHQAEIRDRKERLKNLAGSFEVKDKESIKGRNIILIDDVTTTGATLKEARSVLKKAGVGKVIAFTVAH